MATWKKILTEADKAPNTGTDGASVADGQQGLVTGNSVFDYIETQNFGTSSATGTVESVAGTGNVNGITLASDGDSTDPTLTLAGTLGSIANSQLSNSAVTIGSTAVALGATVTTFAGLASVTSTALVGELTGNASTSTKIASITNSDIVQLDATQTLTNKTIAASQVTEISALTAAEGAQLENIGSTTITAAQWGYLGAATGAITNTDINVDIANLTARLPEISSSFTIGNGTGVKVTIAGDLEVSGTTTTVNSATLTVDDHIITAAFGSTSASAAGTAGLEIATGDTTQLPFVGFVDGAGLTEMVVKAEGNTTARPIAIMDFVLDSASAPAGSVNSAGVGSFFFAQANSTTDGDLYLRVQ
tara:strand:+ start:1986 stop:3071 length:1086 start_codon:yes stop_codon:yes gene_type:complete